MNINWKVRFKNPMFWVGIVVVLISTIVAQLGMSWDEITTWAKLGDVLLTAVSNPVVVVAIIGAVFNAINDPTTYGISDSKNALTYKTPKKE